MVAERIVSLIPAATEWLSALGLGDRLVGVSHECDYARSTGQDRWSVTANHGAANHGAAIDGGQPGNLVGRLLWVGRGPQSM